MIPVSRNIRHMRIFAGVPRGGGVKQQWGCWRWRCSSFSLVICVETRIGYII